MIFEIVLVASALSKIGQGVAATRAAGAARREGNALANDALERGEEEVRRYNMQFAQFIGAQRTSLGAQGIDLDFGTAKDVQDDAAKWALEDVATIRLNAQREARGYKSQYGNYANQQRTAAAFSFLDAGIDAFGYWNSASRVKVGGPTKPSETHLGSQRTARGATRVIPRAPRMAQLPSGSSSRLSP